MLNKKEVYSSIEKNGFLKKSPLLLKILKYLIEAEASGELPKSAQIAHHVLDHDTEVYKDQVSFIRVQIHNLRKKLKLYYLTDGKNEKYHIVIPKGSYKVEYIENKQLDQSSGKNKHLVIALVGFVIFLLGVILAQHLFFYTKAPESNLSSLITSLTEEGEPLEVVVGNRNFYREYDIELDRTRFIWDSDNRYPVVASKMSQMIRQYPERKITISNNSIMTHTDVDNMLFASKISSELTKLNQQSITTISSTLTSIHRNIVFLSKMGDGDLYKLKKSFDSKHFSFARPYDDFDGVKLYYFQQENDTIKINPTVGRKRYFIIKKKMTKEGNKILFLMANQHQSRTYIYEQLTKPSFTEEIIHALGGSEPDEYEVLLEVDIQKWEHRIIFSSQAAIK